ncbi:MAG: glycosyltransferase family 2 protein [Cyclobacteriaceae bacterium]|nr:glycosyltransferase family 2 protein [Cyclobacteriaceae bacterium]
MAENKISVTIITYNEEKNIGRCLDSLAGIADEIIVVDSCSTDRTVAICEEKGCKIFAHAFEGHIEQKNHAISLATYDYVLSLDADECLSDELRQRILEQKPQLEAFDGYRFHRLTNFCGQWIRHCGWYPDTKLRLWNKHHGKWGGTNPHDRVVINSASIGFLTGDLYHYSFYTITEHLAQIQKFSSIAAHAAWKNGKKSNVIINILLGPFYTFFKKFLLQGGLLDGYYGFIISINTAYSRYLKYIKLKELSEGKEI